MRVLITGARGFVGPLAAIGEEIFGLMSLHESIVSQLSFIEKELERNLFTLYRIDSHMQRHNG